jgi:hypothetical protein
VRRDHVRKNRNSYYGVVNATHFIVSTLGVLFAISGMNHGFFEILQGNTPTGGWFIHSIGPRNQMWTYGTEDAFTLIPNFMITGVLAIALSLLIIVWSIGFVQKKHGSLVFLLLFVSLLLVGGGVAQVVFFTLAWAAATRINSPVTFLRAVLPEGVRRSLGRHWLWLLMAFALLGLVALEIAIVGYVPGVNNPESVLHICWSILCIGLGFLLLAIASALVHDLDCNQFDPRANADGWNLVSGA